MMSDGDTDDLDRCKKTGRYLKIAQILLVLISSDSTLKLVNF